MANAERLSADNRQEVSPRHRGVYAVGPGPLTAHGEWLAATLFAGADALLSHFAAAALWRLIEWRGGLVDVTAPRRVSGSAGLRLHRREVREDEWRRCDGVPLTCPSRTIFDCAASATVREVEKLINEAFVLGLPLRPSLPELLGRYPRRPGSSKLRAALQAFETGQTPTESDLEERFIVFLDSYGLPRPETNVEVLTSIGPLNVDCLWRTQRLVIELDARSTHGSAQKFQRDRRRDRALRIAGFKPNRITELDLDDPDSLDRGLRALLAA